MELAFHDSSFRILSLFSTRQTSETKSDSVRTFRPKVVVLGHWTPAAIAWRVRHKSYHGLSWSIASADLDKILTAISGADSRAVEKHLVRHNTAIITETRKNPKNRYGRSEENAWRPPLLMFGDTLFLSFSLQRLVIRQNGQEGQLLVRCSKCQAWHHASRIWPIGGDSFGPRKATSFHSNPFADRERKRGSIFARR